LSERLRQISGTSISSTGGNSPLCIEPIAETKLLICRSTGEFGLMK